MGEALEKLFENTGSFLQNGELGIVLVLCSNNFSRASPIFELVTMKGFTVAFKQYLKGFNYVWIFQYCKLFSVVFKHFSKNWPLRFRPSQFTYLPPPNMVKKSSMETFGYQQGKYTFYTWSIETFKSHQGDVFFWMPCLY